MTTSLLGNFQTVPLVVGQGPCSREKISLRWRESDLGGKVSGGCGDVGKGDVEVAVGSPGATSRRSFTWT